MGEEVGRSFTTKARHHIETFDFHEHIKDINDNDNNDDDDDNNIDKDDNNNNKNDNDNDNKSITAVGFYRSLGF